MSENNTDNFIVKIIDGNVCTEANWDQIHVTFVSNCDCEYKNWIFVDCWKFTDSGLWQKIARSWHLDWLQNWTCWIDHRSNAPVICNHSSPTPGRGISGDFETSKNYRVRQIEISPPNALHTVMPLLWLARSHMISAGSKTTAVTPHCRDRESETQCSER